MLKIVVDAASRTEQRRRNIHLLRKGNQHADLTAFDITIRNARARTSFKRARQILHGCEELNAPTLSLHNSASEIASGSESQGWLWISAHRCHEDIHLCAILIHGNADRAILREFDGDTPADEFARRDSLTPTRFIFGARSAGRSSTDSGSA